MLNIIQNIIDEFQKKIELLASQLYEYLMNGDLHSFEEVLHTVCTDFYNQLAFVFISTAAQSEVMKQKAHILAQKKGLQKPRATEVQLQLRTGHKIKIFSWYASRSQPKRKRKSRKRKRGPNGSGYHLILTYWGCLLKASPIYISTVSQLSVLCPSFQIAVQILNEQGIKCEYKRLRKIALHLAETCFRHGRAKMTLSPGETLSGKRVIISVDGGRTRLRKPKKKKKHNKRAPFDTPWREPKLFVIQVINADGSISKKELPIYDSLIENANAIFDLLAQYLRTLNIKSAKEVLVIADGAPWIWDRAKSMLLQLGVKKSKIVEAIDFYHASENLWNTIKELKRITQNEKIQLFKQLKEALWNGNVDKILDKITALAKGRTFILNKLNYFKKNIHRLIYDKLRAKKLPCGSGIVESAIRRVINLRFKSPSSFWNKNNVQKLIFLRGVFLAGRWNIMISNLCKYYNTI
jgi:hypothetical protein